MSRVRVPSRQRYAARVADVADDDAPADEDHTGERRAHPVEVAVARRAGEHRCVGGRDRVAEPASGLDRGTQRLQRGRARDLAALVAAHAVGDRPQAEALVDEVRVLVALPDAPDIGGGTDGDPHRPASSTVRPNCTRSPRRSFVGVAMRSPLTHVPLVDPRSSTIVLLRSR